MSDSNNPGNAKAEQGGVSKSVWKQMRDTSPNPAVYSQVRQQEGTQNADTWKPETRSDLSDSSTICFHRSKMEFHNMQISHHQYLGKVFHHFQKKLGITENSPKFWIAAIKTNVSMW